MDFNKLGNIEHNERVQRNLRDNANNKKNRQGSQAKSIVNGLKSGIALLQNKLSDAELPDIEIQRDLRGNQELI